MKFQKHLNTATAVLIALLLVSCDSKPRVIESQSTTEEAGGNPVTGNMPAVADNHSHEHEVVVAEVLHTDKYTYLNVSEGDEKFWIAIAKRDVEVGETCYFRGGLLKKNFFSREFNRLFETVYLVSDFWRSPAGSGPATGERRSRNTRRRQPARPRSGQHRTGAGGDKTFRAILQ
jgi:hypothetical protein